MKKLWLVWFAGLLTGVVLMLPSVRQDPSVLSIRQWESRLTDALPAVRYEAALRIGFVQSRQNVIIPILLEALKDQRTRIRFRTVEYPVYDGDHKRLERRPYETPARVEAALALGNAAGKEPWSPLYSQPVLAALHAALAEAQREGDEEFRQSVEEAIAKVEAATHGKPLDAATSAALPASPLLPDEAPAFDPPPQRIERARTHGHDWPSFLGPHGDGRSAETGIVATWPAKGPPLVWQRPLGIGYAMVSVADGRLFENSRHGDLIRLSCLTSEKGQFLWSFQYPTDYTDLFGYNNGPRCSPVVDEDRVYTFGPEGMLHCLSVVDGRLLWKVNTTERFGVVQNLFGVGSTPLVEGDLLIVQVGGSPPEDRDVFPGQLDRVRGGGSGVVAFDKRSGEVRYAITDELASYSSPVAATVAGRRWCFVFARGGLVGFEPASGQVDFHFPWRAKMLGSVNASNPVIVGDRVLISEAYGPGAALLAVQPGRCEVIWADAARRQKSLATHWNTPIHHDGFVYGSSGRNSGDAQLRCVELATGDVRWSEPGLGRSSLVLIDNQLICLTEFGELLWLRVNPQRFDAVSRVTLRNGEQRLLEYPAWAAPIVAHGLLYVRGKDRLACLDLLP